MDVALVAPQHPFSGEDGITVTFESFPGGRIYERTPAGAEHDWARSSNGKA